MNNKYHVDFTSFGEYLDVFEKKTEEFKEIVYRVYNSCDKVDWEGKGFTSAMDIVSNQINELNLTGQMLELLKKFMDTAINNYQEGMEEIKKSFEEILEKIREEKRKRGVIDEELY